MFKASRSIQVPEMLSVQLIFSYSRALASKADLKTRKMNSYKKLSQQQPNYSTANVLHENYIHKLFFYNKVCMIKVGIAFPQRHLHFTYTRDVPDRDFHYLAGTGEWPDS